MHDSCNGLVPIVGKAEDQAGKCPCIRGPQDNASAGYSPFTSDSMEAHPRQPGSLATSSCCGLVSRQNEQAAFSVSKQNTGPPCALPVGPHSIKRSCTTQSHQKLHSTSASGPYASACMPVCCHLESIIEQPQAQSAAQLRLTLMEGIRKVPCDMTEQNPASKLPACQAKAAIMSKNIQPQP